MCPMGLFDGVWMNSLKRQRVMSRLISPKSLLLASCWSFHVHHLLVAWLALRKDGEIAVAFVLVRMLSRCYVAGD